MTKLWIISDLHLETVPFPGQFAPVNPELDVLVVAGDVVSGRLDRGFETIARLAAGKPAVMVLGNHEFWGGEVVAVRAAAARLAARYGVTLLDDACAEIAGIRFVGSTLWGDFLGEPIDVLRTTGEDITVASARGLRRITDADSVALHLPCRAFLEAALAAPASGPTVVVTHHAPARLSVPADIRGDWMAGFLSADLSSLVGRGVADLWCTGICTPEATIASAKGHGFCATRPAVLSTMPHFRKAWLSWWKQGEVYLVENLQCRHHVVGDRGQSGAVAADIWRSSVGPGWCE